VTYKEKTREEHILKIASFFTTSEKFLNHPRGLKFFKQSFPYCRRPLVTGTEIIHEEHPFVEQVKDSKVLVIGGGPSTLRYNWNWEDYDLVFSCTQFYLNAKIRNHVNLVVPMRGGFEDCCKKNNIMVAFDRGKSFVNGFYTRCHNQSVLFQTRYWSKAGVAPRLIVLATLWGAKEVHVVGADGYPKEFKPLQRTKHAFLGGATTANNHSYQRWQTIYLDLWQYLLYKIGTKVKYVNLGYGHPYNISSLYLDNKGNWLS